MCIGPHFVSSHRFSASIIKHNLTELFNFVRLHNGRSSRALVNRYRSDSTFRVSPPASIMDLDFAYVLKASRNSFSAHLINIRSLKEKEKNVVPFIRCHFLTVLDSSVNERFTTINVEHWKLLWKLRFVSHESKLDALATRVLWLFLVILLFTRVSVLASLFLWRDINCTSQCSASKRNRFSRVNFNWINGYLCHK